MHNARHFSQTLSPSSTVRFHAPRSVHDRRRRETPTSEWFEDVHNIVALAYWMDAEGLILTPPETIDVFLAPHKYVDAWERYQASGEAAA